MDPERDKTGLAALFFLKGAAITITNREDDLLVVIETPEPQILTRQT